MVVDFRSVPAILLPCSVSQGATFPGSLALRLLGGSAMGGTGRRLADGKKGKTRVLLTASCGTSISVYVPSMALSPSSGIQGLLGCPVGPLDTTNNLNFYILLKLPLPGNINHYSHNGKQ